MVVAFKGLEWGVGSCRNGRLSPATLLERGLENPSALGQRKWGPVTPAPKDSLCSGEPCFAPCQGIATSRPGLSLCPLEKYILIHCQVKLEPEHPDPAVTHSEWSGRAERRGRGPALGLQVLSQAGSLGPHGNSVCSVCPGGVCRGLLRPGLPSLLRNGCVGSLWTT